MPATESNISGLWASKSKSGSPTVVAATNTFSLATHGLVDGQPIEFSDVGAAVPLAVGTTYYVRDSASGTFKVSATPGGAAFDVTADGTVVIEPKGTPNLAAEARLRMVGGDLDLNREDGSENFSNLDRFGDSVDYITTITGAGTPSIQAQADELARLLYWFFGQQVFTAGSPGVSPPKFEFTPSLTSVGFWTNWWKRVGMSEVVRQRFDGTRVTGLRIEGSSANRVVKVMPTLLSINPGKNYTVDPSLDINMDQRPFLWTEAEGRIRFSGAGEADAVIRGTSQFACVINNNENPWYGDSNLPHEMVMGNAQITLEALTVLLDPEGHRLYNRIIYGTPTPVDGAEPVRGIPPIGSYEIEFRRPGATPDLDLSLKVELPGVKFNPDMAITPNPDGGAIELPLGGAMRRVDPDPSIRVTVETGAGLSAALT